VDGRRAHQCHRDGCDSEARWTCSVVFRDAAGNEYTAATTVAVCDAHVEAATRYVLSEQNWTRLARTMTEAGHAMPLFDSAQPVMVPVATGEGTDGKALRH